MCKCLFTFEDIVCLFICFPIWHFNHNESNWTRPDIFSLPFIDSVQWQWVISGNFFFCSLITIFFSLSLSLPFSRIYKSHNLIRSRNNEEEYVIIRELSLFFLPVLTVFLWLLLCCIFYIFVLYFAILNNSSISSYWYNNKCVQWQIIIIWWLN